MISTVRNKRSSVPEKIPTINQLDLGEIALNHHDAKVYARTVGIGSTVFTINPWNVGVGSVQYNTYFTAGLVGISTTNPSSQLHITEDFTLEGALIDSLGNVGTATSVLTSSVNGTTWQAIADVALQGVQGTTGSQGTQGIQGITGDTGSQGTTGITGSQGTQGIQGITGDTGIQGTQGTTGSQGTTGTTGSQGTTGTTGIQGTQGTTGIQGTQGTTGIQGTQGTTGAGTQGTTGSQGTQGIQGTQGTTGIQGTQGTTGAGTQGTQGIQGITGDTGSQGTIGDIGAQGTQGVLGNSGPSGISTSPKSFTILSPEVDDVVPIFHTVNSYTISNVSSYLNGDTGCGVTFSLKYGTYPEVGSGTSTKNVGYVLTSLTGVTTETTFDSATVPANNVLWAHVKETTGIVTFFHSSIFF